MADAEGPMLSDNDVRMHLFPALDDEFRSTVEISLAPLSGRAVSDEGVLAAAAAMLRSTYPQAIVQRRLPVEPGATGQWDVFRDDAALDDELVQRARAGARDALGQLYDRHHALVYAVATQVVGRSGAADDAVVTAFATLRAPLQGILSVRVRLAKDARAAAVLSLGDDAPAVRPNTPTAALAASIIDLALHHRLVRQEIATVLGLDARDVSTLAAVAFADAKATTTAAAAEASAARRDG